MPVRGLVRVLFVLIAAGGLLACTAPSSSINPTVVKVEISAADGINPGTAGDGLPVPVRLYRLSSRSAFDAATFEDIYHHEMRTLGNQLVGVTEFVLFPGQAEVITREFNDRELHFGIVVAYRNEVPNWRASTSLSPYRTNTIEIRLGPDGVALEKL